MKLNFWQILGIVLIVLGIAGIVFLREGKSPDKTTTPVSPPATVGT